MTDFMKQHRAAMREAQAKATAHRLRSFGWFLLAGIYAVFAQQLAVRAAAMVATGLFYTLAGRLIYVALLLAGFAVMGILGQRQASPFAAMGLPLRPGYRQEWALGAALGWAGMVACVLPIAFTGGLFVTMGTGGMGIVGALLIDLLTLAAAALADELVFRGYAFQRLIEVTGPAFAAILMTLLFMLSRETLSSSAGSILGTLLLGFLLAMAYLRTRALWVGWGFHFAWNASMAVLFGLPVNGLKKFSPVFSTYTSGPAWLTGGGYGPEGSSIAVLVLLGLFIAMAKVTRELRHQWALPEIVGAGMPVDIDPISKKQHEQGMGPGGATQPGSPLVQIVSATPLQSSPLHPPIQNRETPKE